MLRDDQIVDILQLVDFRISKGELGNFFRSADHPKYMECGDQVLRNFLNGLVIYLRGTKDNPKNPQEIIDQNRKNAEKEKFPIAKNTKFAGKENLKPSKTEKKKPGKPSVVEKVKFNNGKKKSNNS